MSGDFHITGIITHLWKRLESVRKCCLQIMKPVSVEPPYEHMERRNGNKTRFHQCICLLYSCLSFFPSTSLSSAIPTRYAAATPPLTPHRPTMTYIYMHMPKRQNKKRKKRREGRPGGDGYTTPRGKKRTPHTHTHTHTHT